jgi:O-antigen ligase
MSTHRSFRRLGALPLKTAAETGFAILAIYHFSGAEILPTGTSGAGEDSGEGGAAFYLLNASIWVVALILSLRRPKAFWRACTADGALIALLSLALISVLWSAAPDIAFRRALALLGTSLFGIYLHLRYPLEEQLKLLAWGLGAGIVLSLPIVAFSGGESSGLLVRGIYENKNSLGRMMALAALVYLFLAWTKQHRPTALMFMGLSVALVLIASSATALVVVLTVAGMIPMLRTLDRDIRPLIVIGCIGVLVVGAVGLFMAPSAESITGLVGRDVTLTGRTALWAAVLQTIGERFWLGYGYETFWLSNLAFRVAVDEGAGWTAPNAHNGFLEITLDLGILGLLLFVFTLARGASRAVRMLQSQRTPLALWPLVYLCFLALYNLTESTALARLNLCWVLYVTTLLNVSPKASRAAEAARGRSGRTPLRTRPALGYFAAHERSLLSAEPLPSDQPPRGRS